MRGTVQKSKAFYMWREQCYGNFTYSSNGRDNRESVADLFNSLAISQLTKTKNNGTSKLSKKQKKAIRRMDEAILTKLSAYFTQWKLKTLLLRGT